MSGPMMQNAILAAVRALFAHSTLQVESTVLKAGVVVKFIGGRWGTEAMWFNFGDVDAVQRAEAHAKGYRFTNDTAAAAEISEGGVA